MIKQGVNDSKAAGQAAGLVGLGMSDDTSVQLIFGFLLLVWFYYFLGMKLQLQAKNQK
jgi:hypothetical protein